VLAAGLGLGDADPICAVSCVSFVCIVWIWIKTCASCACKAMICASKSPFELVCGASVGVGVGVTVGIVVTFVAAGVTVTVNVPQPPDVAQTVIDTDPAFWPVSSRIFETKFTDAMPPEALEMKYVPDPPESETFKFWPTESVGLFGLNVTPPELVPLEPTVAVNDPQPFEVEQTVISVEPFASPVTATALPFKAADATPVFVLFER